MAVWEEPQENIRKDDPYHAWSYRVSQAVEDDTPTTAIVPVLVEVLEPSDGDTLMGNFTKLDEHIKSQPDVKISELEVGAIFKIRPNEPEELPLYQRLVMVYAAEEALFRVEEPVLADTQHYKRWFVGRAIPDAFTDLPYERAGEAGITPSEKSLLAVVDDSFAFLNDAFVATNEDAEPPKFSRFARLLFQDGERFDGDQVYTGAELMRPDINDLLKRRGKVATEEDEDDHTKKGDTLTEEKLYQRPVPRLPAGQSYLPLNFATEAHQPLAFPISHGTHVASTALTSFDTANDLNDTPRGLDLYGITIPNKVTQDTSGQSLGTYILVALKQAMVWADLDYKEDLPLVINFSYGYVAGPKDGSSQINRLIAELLQSRNDAGGPTALVTPMGNDALSQAVMSESLAPQQKVEVSWVIAPDDKTANFLELYASAPGLKVTLIPPSGLIQPVTLTLDGSETNKSQDLHDADSGYVLASVGEWSLQVGSKWSNFGFLAVGPTENPSARQAVVPSGEWTVRIENQSLESQIDIYGVIQRDNASGSFPALGRQSYFDHPEIGPKNGTLAEIGAEHFGGPVKFEETGSVFAYINSPYVYVVGAGRGSSDDPNGTPTEPSAYSSHGPRLNGKVGPSFTALSDRSEFFSGIYGPGTYSGSFFALSGSSVAAPQIAGYLAANPENIGLPATDWLDVVVGGPEPTKPATSQMGLVLN